LDKPTYPVPAMAIFISYCILIVTNIIVKKVYELKKNYFYSEFFAHFLTYF